MMKTFMLAGVACAVLMACGAPSQETETADIDTPVTEMVVNETIEEMGSAAPVSLSLAEVLEAQPDTVKARYDARNPEQTLEFFGIQPGMTVAEVLPGGGWYSKILMPYLGENGTLIGVDYDVDMWKKFGGFANPEFIEKRGNWSQTWVEQAKGWNIENSPELKAFAFGSRPADLDGTVDAVILVRSLHHLNRFDAEHLSPAMDDIKAILKPGGLVGIVQHRAPETNPDDWANGDNGYLKQSFVIEAMQTAGFELVGTPSEINANPRDVPTAEDSVWRLPPTLATSRDNPELKAKMEGVGETDRMTLVFRKPS